VFIQNHINSGITNSIIPDELIVSHVVKKLCPFYGTQKVNFSKKVITCLYSELGESVHTITPYFFKSFNTILLYMPRFSAPNFVCVSRFNFHVNLIKLIYNFLFRRMQPMLLQTVFCSVATKVCKKSR
jgi:hypothetical protein